MGNIDKLKKFGGNIHCFLSKPHHPFDTEGDEMLEVPSISNKPLLRDSEITAAKPLDKNRIQHSYPSRPVKPYQDKDQQVDRKIKVDRSQMGEGITLPPLTHLMRGGDLEIQEGVNSRVTMKQ